MERRLIDRDELWKLFVGHYWDTFAKDRDLILCHIESVMRMAEDIKPEPPVTYRLHGERAEREIERLRNEIRDLG